MELISRALKLYQIREFFEINQQLIYDFVIAKGIDLTTIRFTFQWESVVKLAKRHLRTIRQTHLMFEELSTILTRIEVCMNSLAITSHSIKDFNPLTTEHFLI